MCSRPQGTVAGLVAALILLAAGTASAQTVRIVNYSDWNIEYLFLSYTGDWNWGPDQLGDGVLVAHGGWIDIAAPCAYYDLQLIDEDGDECVVDNIYFCNEVVEIGNDDLLSCQGDTQYYGSHQGSAAATCGLGFELVFVLPPLLWRRRRLVRLPTPFGSASNASSTSKTE
jgi:hypothetical protein